MENSNNNSRSSSSSNSDRNESNGESPNRHKENRIEKLVNQSGEPNNLKNLYVVNSFEEALDIKTERNK